MATLLFKVFALTLKTASKPLAGLFESVVMNHPVARQRIIRVAQWLHRLEVGINRGAEGKAGKVFVAEMTEERAVQLASKVASEGFVYAVGVAIVVMEIDRKRKDDAKKRAKELEEQQHVDGLHNQHLRAEKELRQQQAELQEMLGRMEERMIRMEQRLAEQ